MKVLFIGGTGTISTSCSDLCIKKGMDLWIINRGNRSWRLRKEANFIAADINNEYGKVSALLNKHKWDCVVDWVAFTPEQIQRDINLFIGKTKQYVFISSASVYKGASPGSRIKEGDQVDNAIAAPYAEHKLECEKILLSEHKKNKFPAVIVRAGHTYSEFTIPTNIWGLGYKLVERIKNGESVIVHDNGLSLWTFTHSSDFASGFSGLIGLKQASGEIFHITSPEVLTWLEIFKVFEDLLGVKAKLEFIPSRAIYEIHKDIGSSLLGDKAKNLVFDNSKIKNFVKEFNPKVLFKQGLRQALGWHDKNPDKIFSKEGVNSIVDYIIVSYRKRVRSNEFSAK